MKKHLEEQIRERTARVGIIGLGYVGLPLVRAFHRAGFSVTGFDIDRRKVDALNRGEAYILSVPSQDVAEMVRSGRFHATEDFTKLRQVNAVIICVPTPLTKAREPDLSCIECTARQIRDNLEPGQLIVLESTTYPGTTEEVVQTILEERGLKVGKDFFLAFSPEREDPGNPQFETTSIPKLVGGIDADSGAVASALYATAIRQVVEVSHAKVAEAAKILENIYRAVNIALVNELKLLFDRMDIDVWEVIDAAKTKPFGFHAFYPGPGLGGHCIPIDPFYLTWKAREYEMTTRFIELAGEINTAMPQFVVGKVVEALNRVRKTVNGSRGIIFGLAYKKNTDDIRESPAFKVIEGLQHMGATLCYHDPFVKTIAGTRQYDGPLEAVPMDVETLKHSDFAVIVTDHDNVDYQMLVDHCPLVIDSRNATRNVRRGREKIVKA